MKNKYIKNIKITRITRLDNKLIIRILSLRNQIEVRKNMINREIIKFKDHLNWMKNIIRIKNEYIYTIVIKQKVQGVLRITKTSKNKVEWAFYLDKSCQKIYGSFIEYLSIRKMFNFKYINCINCKVFDFNSSVISLHQKFGFEKIGIEKINKDNLISFMLSEKNWTKKIPAIKAKLRV